MGRTGGEVALETFSRKIWNKNLRHFKWKISPKISSFSAGQGFIARGDLNGFLYANDALTGNPLWIYQLESSKMDFYKILGKDSVLNYDVVFSKEKRQKENKTSVEMLFNLGSIHSSPVIKDGIIYFGSANRNFYAIR